MRIVRQFDFMSINVFDLLAEKEKYQGGGDISQE